MALKQNYGPDFERFWREYPRKVNKGDAYKAFKALKLSPEDVDELVLHIEQRKREDRKWIEGRFVPYAASFLRGHRWEDDYERVKPHWTRRPVEPEPEVERYTADPEKAREALAEAKRALRHVH